MSHHPEVHFHTVVRKLNEHKLEPLWRVMALFSNIETCGAEVANSHINPLFPEIYLTPLNLLSKAILESSAQTYKNKTFKHAEFMGILQLVDRAQSLPEQGTPAYDTLELPELIGPLVNTQFRYQGIPFMTRVARTNAFYSAILRDHQAAVQARARQHFADFNTVFEQTYHVSIATLLDVMQRVYCLNHGMYANRLEPNLERLLGAAPAPLLGQVKVEIIGSLLEQQKTITDPLVFTVEKLNAPFLPLASEVIEGCLNLLSRDTKDMRLESNAFPLRTGYIDSSISVLERYPIIELPAHDGERRFIVPNLRFLSRAASDVVMRMLEEALQGTNTFGHTRGAIYEVYLEQLLLERLPEATLILEREYDRQGQQVKGSDVTLIDPRCDRLLLIEAKAHRVQDHTRAAPRVADVAHEVRSALEAISERKAGAKLDDLRARLPEFADVQAQIDAATGRPIVLAVIEDGTELLDQFLDLYMQQEQPELLQLPYDHAVLSLEEFERAVEIAARDRLPLQVVLEQRFVRRTRDPKNFNQTDAGHPLAFAASFAKRFVVESFENT
jgi:hypothetical protein